MQVTKHIHSLEIPFKIPASPDKLIDRVVYSYLILGEKITLIDSGVAGADSIISNYIKNNGRDPREISMLILSHSHPDHLGGAKSIKEMSGCSVFAHANEKGWIEDTEKQCRERPVPGFQSLVGGSVVVDKQLEDGETLGIDREIECKVVHTPGHSSGSLSLLFEKEKALFTGDALPLPGDLPLYEDIADCVKSIRRLQSIGGVEVLLSSWEPPIHGQEKINERIEEGISYLRRIHNAVLKAGNRERKDSMETCKQVLGDLGLPPFAANPLIAKALASSFAVEKSEHLF